MLRTIYLYYFGISISAFYSPCSKNGKWRESKSTYTRLAEVSSCHFPLIIAPLYGLGRLFYSIQALILFAQPVSLSELVAAWQGQHLLAPASLDTLRRHRGQSLDFLFALYETKGPNVWLVLSGILSSEAPYVSPSPYCCAAFMVDRSKCFACISWQAGRACCATSMLTFSSEFFISLGAIKEGIKSARHHHLKSDAVTDPYKMKSGHPVSAIFSKHLWILKNRYIRT